MSEEKTPLTKISQDDYDNYQYHCNIICIFDKQNPSDIPEKIKQAIQESQIIVNYIESELWMLKKNQESSLSTASVQRLKDVDDYITFINIQRIYLGIIRNIYTFATTYTCFANPVKEINADSTLLASYLYPLRIIIFLFKAALISWNNSTEFSLFSGLLKAHQQRLLNDIIWTLLLIGVTMSIYLTDAASQAFFQNELTMMMIGFIVAAGFLFDVWNAGNPSRQLARDWEKFKKTYQLEFNNKENDFEQLYQQELKKRNAKVCEAWCFFGLYSSYAIINSVQFGLSMTHQLSPIATLAFPWIDFSLTLVMLGARVYFIFREYFSPEFQNLSEEERATKLKEMWIGLGKELLKITALAITIFLIASQLHLAIIPTMLALGAITFGLITLSNMLADFAKSYIPNEWFKSPSKGAALQ